MSKKFDAEAYVARWESIVLPGMLVFIVASLVAATYLNIATRPDCIRHEYVYCGTPSQSTYGQEHEGGSHDVASPEGAHGAHP